MEGGGDKPFDADGGDPRSLDVGYVAAALLIPIGSRRAAIACSAEPVADRTSATIPPTVIRTLFAPNPIPVIVTTCRGCFGMDRRCRCGRPAAPAQRAQTSPSISRQRTSRATCGGPYGTCPASLERGLRAICGGSPTK